MIKYETKGCPTKVGVYACRVESGIPNLLKDQFLIWIEGKWGYCGSDQNFRGKVFGWIGPLQRRLE